MRFYFCGSYMLEWTLDESTPSLVNLNSETVKLDQKAPVLIQNIPLQRLL